MCCVTSRCVSRHSRTQLVLAEAVHFASHYKLLRVSTLWAVKEGIAICVASYLTIPFPFVGMIAFNLGVRIVSKIML